MDWKKDLIQRSYLDFPWITRISVIVGLMEALRCADKDNYPGQPRVTMQRPGPGGVHCLMSHTLVTRGNINTVNSSIFCLLFGPFWTLVQH